MVSQTTKARLPSNSRGRSATKFLPLSTVTLRKVYVFMKQRLEARKVGQASHAEIFYAKATRGAPQPPHPSLSPSAAERGIHPAHIWTAAASEARRRFGF